MNDYYQTLGVSRDADPKTIKSAYRRLIKEYHPDRNSDPGAEEKFKKIQKAYEVLSDETKRADYDRYGHNAYEQQSDYQQRYQGAGTSNANSGFGGFNQGFYQTNVNSRMVKLKSMPWYLQIVMAIVIFFIIIGIVIFAIIGTILTAIFRLISSLFK